ncbi:proline racemase family protein [Sphingomonas sp. MMSM20]|uniref:proline racemase family protein n=1 Tax=Sphingomonas lycopersici TaxID=2951807 RepID=UPI00223728F0|nr:proline racemase family protein [Sphingomonas lycopersici]MCW6532608.1 proline racemase family protein [Sphingomonas lycopersici]
MAGETITQLSVVDMHTAGEPVRIVVAGYPALAGATILDKRRAAQAQHDALRRALMFEPRGHADMYGVIPVAPTHPEAVFGALFTHHEGYSTMCGHATIALGKWLVESGRVAATEPETRFAIELPCGLVRLCCTVQDGRVVRTAFDSVPAFLAQRDAVIEVAGFGAITCDLAYGGAFYALLPASRLGLDFFDTPLDRLVAAGKAITEAGRRTLNIVHPDAADLGFLYGTILTDDAPPPAPSYNLCVFADGQVDRSPTGSGVTARMAADHARGLIAAGVERSFSGPTGIPFTATAIGETKAGTIPAVQVRVAGHASFTGTATFTIDPADALGFGFTLPASYGALRR